MIFYTKSRRLPPSCFALIWPGVDALHSGPVPPIRYNFRAFSSSATVHANRLQETAELRNAYFALRHGQSFANLKGIIASDPSTACDQYGLTSAGREQAQAAALSVVKYFANQKNIEAPFEGVCVLTSDFLRAKETARVVVDAIQQHNLEIPTLPIHLYKGDAVIETRLRERWFGEWDLSRDSNYIEVWKDDALDPSHTRGGVESVDSVVERVTRSIIEWDALFENKMVVCVAHGDILQILQTSFRKLDGSKHRTLNHLETATLRRLELFVQ